ncbi:WD40-repeat-containing domain protein [Limtongia smithiae]|uniref:WD40-repeat-containing domain protein n=1 Tax=Limtongia smithiae TaxID=1125753 RepID=UPI0034CD946D
MDELIGSRYVPLTCTGHSRPVTHLSFSTLFEDGSYLMISACKDGTPMLRDGVTGDWIGTYTGHKGAVWSARFSSDASLSVTGGADFTAKVWDTMSGKELMSFPHHHIVRTAAFMPARTGAQLLVTAGNEKKIRIWDLNASATVTHTPLLEWTGAEGTIKSALWVNQTTVVTAGDDKTVRWWDLRSRPTTTASGELVLDGPITQMEEHDDGIIAVCAGSCMYMLSAKSHQLLNKVALSYNSSAVSIHPTRRRFATGSTQDTWVRFHDYESGKILETLKGHHGPVHSISYSPDGQLCASGGEDGTIRLWKTAVGPYGLWK